MPFEQDLGIVVFAQNTCDFVELLLCFVTQLGRIEFEKKAGVECQVNAFTHPFDGCIGNGLFEFFGLFIHMPSNKVASRTTHRRSDQCAYGRIISRKFADGSAGCRTARDPDAGSFLSTVQALATR